MYCCIGEYGLNAGPTKHIVDDNALSDPLLARLPVSPRVYFDFWTSHYFRDLPEGYLESNERDQNLLTDPLLHGYYDKLRNVTRGSVFRMSRLRDIWSLNVSYRHLQDDFEKRRPIELSIPGQPLPVPDRCRVSRRPRRRHANDRQGGLSAVRPGHSAPATFLSRPMDGHCGCRARRPGRGRRSLDRRRPPDARTGDGEGESRQRDPCARRLHACPRTPDRSSTVSTSTKA